MDSIVILSANQYNEIAKEKGWSIRVSNYVCTDNIKVLEAQLKEANEKIEQLLERETKLEAYCNAIYECFEKLYDHIPFHVHQFSQLNEIARVLFNQAEISSDITERVKMEIEWEDNENSSMRDC